MASTMLFLYRRHEAKCPHKGKGRAHQRCKCPVWVDGTLVGARINRSLDTRDWNRAGTVVRDWEYSQAITEERSHSAGVRLACDTIRAWARSDCQK